MLGACPSRTAPIRPVVTVDIVQHDLVERSSARASSAPYTSGTRNPPPPTIASFTRAITSTPARLSSAHAASGASS